MTGRLFWGIETALSFHPLRRVLLCTTNRAQSNCQIRKQSRVRIANQKTTTAKANLDLMADQAPKQKPEGKEKQVAGEEKKSPIPATIPPPPEKPLPGDCCGNGCVPCVWDIYNEELEEYNKLYKPDDSGPKPKP